MFLSSLVFSSWVSSIQAGGTDEPDVQARPSLENEGSQLTNPFAGFKTSVLANGLRLWTKRIPESQECAISVSIPFGSNQDPQGLEEMSHLLEHLLFADQKNKSESQIRREIEELGGTQNATTFPDHTFYYVHLPKQHGLFGLDWLFRIIQEKDFTAAMIEKHREPVLLEIGATSWGLFEFAQNCFFRPPFLRMDGFWQREFGLEDRSARFYYPFRSLSRISPRDLKAHYSSFYAPSNITLAFIGGFDPEALMAKVQETFGSLPPGSSSLARGVLRNPHRGRVSIAWASQPNIDYELRVKFYEDRPDDFLLAVFLLYYLDLRSNHLLRFGERKTTYGVNVSLGRMIPAYYLSIGGGFRSEEFEHSRMTIESELDRLRAGTIEDLDFEKDKGSVLSRIRRENQAPKDLEWWIKYLFYDPGLTADFPDLVTFCDGITKEKLRDFASRNLASDRLWVRIVKPLPLPRGYEYMRILLAFSLAVWTGRRILGFTPYRTDVLFVGRLGIPLLLKTLLVLGLLFLSLLCGRGIYYLYEYASFHHLEALDSPGVRFSAEFLVWSLIAFQTVLWSARLPTKIWVFRDRVVLEYLFGRHRTWSRSQMGSISRRSFREVWGTSRLFSSLALTFGIREKGILIEGKGAKSLYFRALGDTDLVTIISGE